MGDLDNVFEAGASPGYPAHGVAKNAATYYLHKIEKKRLLWFNFNVHCAEYFALCK